MIHAPSCAASAVRQPALDGGAGGRSEFRRLERRNQVSREQREQVRNVPMAGLHLVVVLRPLLDLSPLADLQRIEPGARGLDSRAEIRVDLENITRFNDPPEKLLKNLGVHGGPHGEDSALTRARPIRVFRRE